MGEREHVWGQAAAGRNYTADEVVNAIKAKIDKDRAVAKSRGVPWRAVAYPKGEPKVKKMGRRPDRGGKRPIEAMVCQMWARHTGGDLTKRCDKADCNRLPCADPAYGVSDDAKLYAEAVKCGVCGP